MSTTQRDITGFLNEASSGDSFAISKLWQEVQCDVHDMAENICRREYSGNTVQPTVLVNEVWIRLYGKDGAVLSWENRAHFFGSVARSMGQILVDYARKRNAKRRGGGNETQGYRPQVREAPPAAERNGEYDHDRQGGPCRIVGVEP